MSTHHIIETARPERETWEWTRSPALDAPQLPRLVRVGLELAAVVAFFGMIVALLAMAGGWKP